MVCNKSTWKGKEGKIHTKQNLHLGQCINLFTFMGNESTNPYQLEPSNFLDGFTDSSFIHSQTPLRKMKHKCFVGFVRFLCQQKHGNAEREDTDWLTLSLSQNKCPSPGIKYITVYGQAELTWVPLELQLHGRRIPLVSFCKTSSPLS